MGVFGVQNFRWVGGGFVLGVGWAMVIGCWLAGGRWWAVPRLLAGSWGDGEVV